MRIEDRGPGFEVSGSRTENRYPRSEIRGSRTRDPGSRFEDPGLRIEQSGSRTEDREPKTEDRGPSIEGRDWNIEGRVVARAENRGSRIEDPGSRLEGRRLDEFGQVWREPRGRVRNGCGRHRRSEILPPPNNFETGPTRIPATSPERMWPEQARWNGRRRNARGDTPLSQTSSGHV